MSLRRFDETGSAQPLGCEHSSGKHVGLEAYDAGNHQNVRYTTFARQTGATPSGDVASAPDFRQRIAAGQECDECLPGLLSNDSPMFAATLSY
jgi:hypothetical protein